MHTSSSPSRQLRRFVSAPPYQRTTPPPIPGFVSIGDVAHGVILTAALKRRDEAERAFGIEPNEANWQVLLTAVENVHRLTSAAVTHG